MSDNAGIPLDFLVVGGQRCGTGWLAQCLREHPDVYMAADESRYFTTNFERGAQWWKDTYLRGEINGKLIGEKCANYLTSGDALERIQSQNDNIKVVICVRNPVERYRSARLMKNRMAKGGLELDVMDGEDFEKGLFGRYCSEYISRFKAENVLIIFYDDMINWPEKTIERICKFLSIDSKFKPKSTRKQTKPGAIENKYPWFAKVAFLILHRHSPFGFAYTWFRRKLSNTQSYSRFELELMDLYRADIKMLETLTGRELALWTAGEYTS